MSTLTKYKMVKEEIKRWIFEGRITPKEKIGSENDLMASFGVSRHTIRQAIGELVNEGWLYREHGVGTFCADRSEPSNGKHTKTIGIITTYISDYIFPSIIRGAESYLTDRGYSVLLASTNNDIEREKQCLHNLLNHEVSGLIVEPTKSALYNPNLAYYLNLERQKLPFLMINANYDGLNSLSLTVDDERGGYLATEHLIKLGHRRILGLFKMDDRQGVGRMKGFIRAHREADLSVSPDMLVSYTTEEKEGKPVSEVRRLLEGKEDLPTAIIAYNDEIAISVIQVLRELGLRIPEDISLVGYDDSQLAEASEVKLTSIRHPQSVMGETAAKLILAMIEGNSGELQPIVYEPVLMIRNSTCAPRS